MDESKALAEVYDIINNLEYDLYEKIPKSFLEFIDENRDKNYISTIDYSKSINSQNVSDEARAILALIYRDYLCSEEEKEKLKREDEI